MYEGRGFRMAKLKRVDPPMYDDYDDEEEVLDRAWANIDKNNEEDDDDGKTPLMRAAENNENSDVL
jgi:hypothetical protein